MGKHGERAPRADRPQSTACRANVSGEHYAQLLGDIESYVGERLATARAGVVVDQAVVHATAEEILDIILKNGAGSNKAVKDSFSRLQPKIHAEFTTLLQNTFGDDIPQVALENQQINNMVISVGAAIRAQQSALSAEL